MTVIRWGILGASNFALNQMEPAIHAAHGAELAALATGSPDKAEAFRAFAPGLRVHDSYDALLAEPGIDAVYIPLPNHLHADWALKANAAGKPVLVEKPVAMDVAQLDRLIAARDASGLLIAEALMILHHPQWIRARDWILGGEIGAVVHADAAFTFMKLDQGNIRNRPETGGGSLRDIGVYTLGAIRFACGAEPLTQETRLRLENGIDSFAHVFGLMEGAQGPFTYGSITGMRAYNRQVVTVQGTKGMVRLEGGCFNAGVNDLATVELHQQGNRVTVERFPAVRQYELQVEAFGRAIQGQADWPVPLEFSRATQAMLDRAYAEGQAIG